MRETEFENQVRLKMEDFDLRPSDEVWREVERRVGKEKKRRFIFWWPLLFLLAGGGATAIILFSNKKGKSGAVTVNKNNENKILSSSGKPMLTEPSPPLVNDVAPGISANGKGGVINQENSKIIKSSTGKKVQESFAGSKQPGNKIVIVSDAAKIKFGGKKNMIDIAEKQIVDQDRNQEVTIVVPSKPDIDPPDSTIIIDNSVPEKKDLQQIIRKEEGQMITDSLNKEQNVISKEKKSRKWNRGIVLSGGGSTVVNGLNLFNKEKSLSSSPQSLGSPGIVDRRYSPKILPSASFGAGLYVKRAVSKKLDIILGLGYSFLSTKMKVGNRVDSMRIISGNNSQGLMVNYFYRAGGNSSYTNRYHFISVSGDISWRIINGRKLKINWENGVSYSRLLSSGMLHFNDSLAGYYKDNQLMTKNYFQITTGISVPVGNRVVINPFVAYSLAPVLKNSGSSGTHFVNYGIRLRFLINK